MKVWMYLRLVIGLLFRKRLHFILLTTIHWFKVDFSVFCSICLKSGNMKPLVAKWSCCFKDIFIYMYIYIYMLLRCIVIWDRSRRCVYLVTWFCYQMITKPCNKIGLPSSPEPTGHSHLSQVTNTHHKSSQKRLCLRWVDLLIKVSGEI